MTSFNKMVPVMKNATTDVFIKNPYGEYPETFNSQFSGGWAILSDHVVVMPVDVRLLLFEYDTSNDLGNVQPSLNSRLFTKKRQSRHNQQELIPLIIQ